MANFRTFCMAAALAALVLDAKRQDKAAAAAVGKAADFCHAKNLKILVTGAAKDVVMFRCVAN